MNEWEWREKKNLFILIFFLHPHPFLILMIQKDWTKEPIDNNCMLLYCWILFSKRKFFIHCISLPQGTIFRVKMSNCLSLSLRIIKTFTRSLILTHSLIVILNKEFYLKKNSSLIRWISNISSFLRYKDLCMNCITLGLNDELFHSKLNDSVERESEDCNHFPIFFSLPS